MTAPAVLGPELLTTAEVAAMFRVEQCSVRRWVRHHYLTAIRTPGGKNYRYLRDEVVALLKEDRS